MPVPVLPGDDEVLLRFQPGALCQLQSITSIEPAPAAEVDVFDAGVGEAQLGRGQAIGQTPVGPHGSFPIQHQSQPFVAAEIGGFVLFGQLPVGGSHAGQTERVHLIECRVCQHREFPLLIDSRCRHGYWRAQVWL